MAEKTMEDLIGEFADAEFACGEWTDEDDEKYEALSSRALAARQALVASAAEMEADRRRLDWAESRLAAGEKLRIWKMKLGTYIDESLNGQLNDGPQSEGDHLRGAIDAAMRTTEAKG